MKLPPLKRLFRFSLRAMLVVVTVLCVLLGFKVRQVNKQKEVVAWVVKNGGSVAYDYEVDDDKDRWNLNAEPPRPKWLRELIGVDYFATLIGVGLFDSEVTDVAPLTSLTNLELLNLKDTKVSDLSPLANPTDLESLDLSGTQVSDLSPLANLTKLHTLLLLDTRVTDEEIAKLQKALPNCKIIH